MFQFIFLTDSLCGLMAGFFQCIIQAYYCQIYRSGDYHIYFTNRPSVTNGYENRCTLKDKSSVTCVQPNGYYSYIFYIPHIFCM